ncbi:hypothetical protein BJV77DRAFT_254861 [Russula vinacea]|nr:hypothetical protein BJV77DRAFT_254861 [Russula vinacea]
MNLSYSLLLFLLPSSPPSLPLLLPHSHLTPTTLQVQALTLPLQRTARHPQPPPHSRTLPRLIPKAQQSSPPSPSPSSLARQHRPPRRHTPASRVSTHAAVAQVNCTSITAVACYCANQTFPAALYSCVATNCSSSVPAAEALAQRFCAIDSTTLSFASTVGPSTASSSSPTTNPFATNTNAFNAAPASPWMPDTRGWTGMALAACGAVFGAALL